MDYKQITTDVKNGNIKPVYFLFGEEPYPIEKLVRLVINSLTDESTRDFNCDVLFADETDADSIISLASSFPMMSERRVVVCQSTQKFSTYDKKKILAYAQNPAEFTCFILTAGKIDRRQKFYADLIKSTISFESKPLYENQAVQWISRYCAENGLTISRGAALILVEQSGTTLWNAVHELEKVMAFIGESKDIKLEDVTAVSGMSRRYNLWELTDAVARKDFQSGLQILDELLEARQSAVGMVMDLTRRIVQLVQCRALIDKGNSQDQVIQKLGLRSYFGRLFVQQAQGFSMVDLKSAIRTLVWADHAMKTGYLQGHLAMTLVLYDLIQGQSQKRFFS
ncbi:DNA polymerase III subunit delta [candidate division KSB1 bacterium]|nr:DNA polymerase III subunit delta [candidate division KSB1 bacterium]